MKGKVWKYDGQLDHDSVIEFVDNARLIPYMSSWVSPLGPMGFIKGLRGTFKSTILRAFPLFVKYFGVSRWTGFFIVVICFAVAVLVLAALVAYASVDKLKIE